MWCWDLIWKIKCEIITLKPGQTNKLDAIHNANNMHFEFILYMLASSAAIWCHDWGGGFKIAFSIIFNIHFASLLASLADHFKNQGGRSSQKKNRGWNGPHCPPGFPANGLHHHCLVCCRPAYFCIFYAYLSWEPPQTESRNRASNPIFCSFR